MSEFANAPADEPAVKTEKVLSRRVGRERLLLVAGGVLLLAAGAGISQLIATHTQRDTVVFDMKGTIDTFMQQSAEKKLDADSARALTVRFNQALNVSLQQWHQTHDALVLASGAVINIDDATPDITAEIQADIARQMQEAP